MNRLGYFLLALLALPLFAQDKPRDFPPPQAPFFKTPPAGYQWSAEVSYPNATPAPPPTSSGSKAPVPVTLVRLQAWMGKNQIEKDLLSFSNKQEKLRYIVGDHQLEQYGDSDKISVLPVGLNLFTEKPFPGLRGLSLETYTRIEMIEKEPCYKFKVVTVQPDTQTKSTVVTWIRIADGYPRRVESDEETLDFAAVIPFSEEISLPPACQPALNQLHAERQALEAMGKRNGQ